MKIKQSYIITFLSLALVILFAILKNFDPRYNESINNIIYSTSLLIPVVIGTQILLITGYYDLSIGSLVTLIGLVITIVYLKSDSLLFSILIGIFISIVVGAINGILITKYSLNSLIVTIATTSILTGLSLYLSGGAVLVGLPTSLKNLFQEEFFGIQVPIYLSFFLAGIIYLFCEFALIFRRFYQVGSSPASAKSCGIKVNFIIIIAYIFSGIGGALVGLFEVSRTLSATPVSNNTLALDLIASCVIGGSSLNGGKGNILGAVLGLIITQSIEFIVVLMGLDIFWRYIAIGFIIIFVVIFNNKFNNFKIQKI